MTNGNRLSRILSAIAAGAVPLFLTACNEAAAAISDPASVALMATGGALVVLCALYVTHHLVELMTSVIGPGQGPPQGTKLRGWITSNGQELLFFAVILGVLLLFSTNSFGQVRIPGSDESAKLKAAGTLLMLIDTALFVWLARIFAGLCVLSAGWLIKEQKFGPAVVCVLGALIIGTSPMWVQNIFEIGGGGGVFK